MKNLDGKPSQPLSKSALGDITSTQATSISISRSPVWQASCLP